jgi:hypothetical protein
MPKALERQLKRKAAKKFPGDKERQDKYVYGTLRKTGWRPSREKKSKRRGLRGIPRREVAGC